MGAVLAPDTDQIGTADQECGLEEMDPRPVQPPGSVERLDDEKTCLLTVFATFRISKGKS